MQNAAKISGDVRVDFKNIASLSSLISANEKRT
jgi:hypothetical protein